MLHKYGQMGVDALSAASPVDTGELAASWSYTVNISQNQLEIIWTNSSMAGRVPVAILIQYGHAVKKW